MVKIYGYILPGTPYIYTYVTKGIYAYMCSQVRHTYVTKAAYAVIYLCVPGTSTYHIYSCMYDAWYELVPASNSASSWNLSLAIRAHITTKLHEIKTALDASRGEWRCN